MFSVIIATHNSERLLGPTLVALVPGALAGLVREVLVADRGSKDATAAIADLAGARLIDLDRPEGERLAEAGAQARAPWLMFIRPGLVPAANWTEAAERFLIRADAAAKPLAAATFTPETRVRRWRDFPAVALALARGAPLRGLLIRKEVYLRLGGHRAGTDADVVRRLGRRRVTRLEAAALDLAAEN